MNPKEFKAPFIPIQHIRSEADNFRQTYWPSNTIPVNIFDILEFELDIEMRTISTLKKDADIDALLLGDLKTIVVDTHDLMDDRSQNRLKFSIAHEIGHLVLHADVFETIKFSSIDEWIQFFQEIPEDQYRWIENHAYEFAGRLLVPADKLKEALKDAISKAESLGFDKWDASGESTLEYISNGIARGFEVSGQVIEKRLIKEGLWPLPEK